jgi:hypothetical protein
MKMLKGDHLGSCHFFLFLDRRKARCLQRGGFYRGGMVRQRRL